MQHKWDRESRRTFVTISTMAVIGAAMMTLAMCAEGRAHQASTGWQYPVLCCSGRDCAEIPASAVREGPDGYRITLTPEQHPMLTEPASFLVPYRKAKPSPDGLYHACIGATGRMLCFFAGARMG